MAEPLCSIACVVQMYINKNTVCKQLNSIFPHSRGLSFFHSWDAWGKNWRVEECEQAREQAVIQQGREEV